MKIVQYVAEGPPQLTFMEANDLASALGVHLRDAVVTNDVAAVVLEVRFNGKMWIVTGSAKRDPRDRPDRNLALTLATSRALQKLANQFARQANGAVKHNDDVRRERKRQIKRKIKSRRDADNAESR